jgi:creatinine amidohydrolase
VISAAQASPARSAAPQYTGAQPIESCRSARRLAAMTWCDVRDALARGRDRVVVPFGACEQHGTHLPLETDTRLGDGLGPLLAERIDALCAPTVPIGCSEEHMSRAGTLSLQPETLALIVHDLVSSLARHGFRTVVLLPTHAGNAGPLAHIARSLKPPAGIRIAAVTDMRALAAALDRAGSGTAPAEGIAHTGEIETSLLLTLAPQAVCARGPERLEAQNAAGRVYLAAFLAECVKQLAAQGVTPSPRGSLFTQRVSSESNFGSSRCGSLESSARGL